MTQKRAHPHFDDHGTLDWTTRWAEALAQAKRERKHVFVELGREACGQCRALVQSVVPRPDVAPLLQAHFVALAADADDTESEVEELALNLEDAMMLPFVLFADADGRFVDGLSGGVNPALFAATLKRIAGAT
ncbi:MAG: thioredoxin family protein [Planctomycetes bacterium]|nr:thioredoxin family protein [Planctomycetota bacterium]